MWDALGTGDATKHARAIGGGVGRQRQERSDGKRGNFQRVNQKPITRGQIVCAAAVGKTIHFYKPLRIACKHISIAAAAAAAAAP